MKHALKNSIEDNMHGLLECIFVEYAATRSYQIVCQFPASFQATGKLGASFTQACCVRGGALRHDCRQRPKSRRGRAEVRPMRCCL